MQLTTISQIKKHLLTYKLAGKKIALVPTMGALHQGHLALVKRAKEIADIVVVSIFVNKTQFNDQADYQKYPRQIAQDIELLKEQGVDYIFTPSDEEIYPNGKSSFKIIAQDYVNCLCGANRPGHFDGVALIVTKLFNIIEPNISIFGQKDFQQVLVIKKLVQDLNINIEIVTYDIVREASGLAMSSRNQRLSDEGRKKAANIYRILQEIKSSLNDKDILAKKRQELLDLGFEKIDYLEIRDEENLTLVENENNKNSSRIFVAAYLEQIRLIDNLKL